MKEKFLYLLSICEITFGSMFFVFAQWETMSNSRYTWSRPYSSYEILVISIKWIAVILVLSGIVLTCLQSYSVRFTSAHTQKITSAVRCINCGLNLSTDVKNCPRCGNLVNVDDTRKDIVHFCSKCGNSVNANENFCSKCGQKIL